MAVNQLINVAVAEKVSALRTEEYFAERAQRGDVRGPSILAGIRSEWPNDPGVEFHLSHGDWVRLAATMRYPLSTPDWAGPWPCEEVWKARQRT